MIYISPNSDKIISARKYHVEELKRLLSKRIKNKRLSLHDSQYEFLDQHILTEIEKILGGLPHELIELLNGFELNNHQKHAIKRLFDYSKWFCRKDNNRYNAYDLASKIDINTCVYCNRNYTSTVAGITRPQFDHYFSQVKFPLFALSFYNLIPSCSVCNSDIKGRKELFLDEHLHPYIDDSIKDFRFSYYYNSKSKDDLSINIVQHSNNVKAEKTFEFFKIKQVYNAHTDELRDLIKMRETFSDKYLEILSSKIFESGETSQSELYQLAFGNYFDDDKISMRPFSKFKKDILTELGIIT
jgi:hypothetical protein